MIGMRILFVFVALLLSCAAVGRKKRIAEAEAKESQGDAENNFVDIPRKRGGIRQRRDAAAEATATPPTSASSSSPSSSALPLNNELKRDWALGKLSSAQVQKYAWSAMEQGAIGLKRLSAIGNSGRNPQNLLRALMHVFGHPRGAPPFGWIEIPTVHGTRTPHPFLYPHLLFKHLYAENRAAWETAVRGAEGGSAEFWSSLQDSEYVRRHPTPERIGPATIPLGFHGDGGAYSKHDSIYVFSWNSLLGSGTTKQKRFIATVVRKADMVPGTMDAIFKVIAWSFNVLLDGRTPANNYYGLPNDDPVAPLADGWNGALAQIRGDWAFYTEVFKFPQWNSAMEMCWLCRASSIDPTLSWTDCRKCALWRGTLRTHESYLEKLRADGFATPVLLGEIIGMRLEHIMIDVLHCVDLGIAAHIIGNVLWIFFILRACLGGRTYADRVEALREHLKAWYRSSKCDCKLQGKLTLDRLRGTSSEWPKLKGKAASTRKLALFALEVALQFGTDSDEDRTIIEVCRLLVRFYQILESESQFLSPETKCEMQYLGQALAELYSKLASDAFNKGARLWKMSPKLHLFEHLCELQCIILGNPRFYWCYSDEDLVGIMTDIAETCHPRTMAITVMVKWLHCCFSE